MLDEFVNAIYGGFDVENSIEPTMWQELTKIMNDATAKGLSKGEFSIDHNRSFLDAVKHANEIFAAFKTHAMGKSMASKLIDDNGNLKPFDKWMKDISSISSHHVGSWLKTEYNTAVLRAHNAADWRSFMENKDIMPNLRWMPTTSPDAEAVHRGYWEKKLTLPVEHSFWNKHHPGDRWNCKCSLESTDDPASPDDVIDDLPIEPAQRGLENNPGKDGKIFNDTHPYFPKNCNQCSFYKNRGFKNKMKTWFNNHEKDCYKCEFINKRLEDVHYKEVPGYNGRFHISENADKSEIKDNVRCAESLLNSFKNMTLKIRPHVYENNVKNPEYEINGKIADRKGIEHEEGVCSAFKKAIKQGCSIVVLDLDMHPDNFRILRTNKLSTQINHRHQDFTNKKIDTCYVVYKNKAIEINSNHFKSLDKYKNKEKIKNELNKIGEL